MAQLGAIRLSKRAISEGSPCDAKIVMGSVVKDPLTRPSYSDTCGGCNPKSGTCESTLTPSLPVRLAYRVTLAGLPSTSFTANPGNKRIEVLEDRFLVNAKYVQIF